MSDLLYLVKITFTFKKHIFILSRLVALSNDHRKANLIHLYAWQRYSSTGLTGDGTSFNKNVHLKELRWAWGGLTSAGGLGLRDKQGPR